MQPGNISDFFTWASLLTLQGATGAAWLVPNALGFLFGSWFDSWRKWAAIITAFAIEYFIAISATDAGDVRWFLGFLNGLLIFASALGLNQIGHASTGAGGAAPTAGNRRFRTTWI